VCGRHHIYWQGGWVQQKTQGVEEEKGEFVGNESIADWNEWAIPGGEENKRLCGL